jgi:hypothetical protein
MGLPFQAQNPHYFQQNIPYPARWTFQFQWQSESDRLIVRVLNLAMQWPNTSPPDPRLSPFGHEHLDNIAHAMWELAIENEGVMASAANRASAFPVKTLRALAKLNFLPVWWMFRRSARKCLFDAGFAVDDSLMNTLWEATTALFESPPQQMHDTQEAMHTPRCSSSAVQTAREEDEDVLKVDE